MRLLHRERQPEHDEDRATRPTLPASTDDTIEARDRADVADPTDVRSRADDPTVVRHDEPTMVREQPRAGAAAPIPEARERPGQTRTATVRERTWTFAPGQLVSFIAGVGLIVLGVIAMVRAGIDGSFGTPTVEVLGYTHTAWLGLAEVGLGLLLVLAGTGAWGRPLSVLLGAATVVAGVLVLAEWDQMPEELGIERSYGWPLVGLGAVVALAAMALPVWRRRHLREDDLLELRDDPRFIDAKHPYH
jgi:hypothetical protein